MIKDACSERHFISLTWYFLTVTLIYLLIADCLVHPDIVSLAVHLAFVGIFAAVNLIRQYLYDYGIIDVDYFYMRSRLIETIIICFGFFFMGINPWTAGYIMTSVVLVTILEGRNKGLHTMIMSFVTVLVFVILSAGLVKIDTSEFMTFVFIVAANAAGWGIAAVISDERHYEYMKGRDEFEQLVREKEEVSGASGELEEKNEKLKEKMRKIEELNDELKISLNKYYEFHHISTVVGSIYDTNGLLKFINETIVEIIEADYSTIFLFEPKRGSLEVQCTNITSEDNLNKLMKNINNDLIFDIIENGSPFVVNVVESSDYEFVRGRDVKSFVCMPISTTKKKYGIILIESGEFNKFHDENQKLVMLIGHQLSTSIENLELYKRMKELATTDGLTGVYNRLYFHERLSKEMKIAHEHDYPLSLVILDIDHFKKVNDTYSHLIGDKILKIVTSAVKNSIRRSDMIARYGGEEFVVLFPNMDIKRAEETCENLRKKIQESHLTNREIDITVTASFGVANYPHNAFSEENLIKAADRALYKAKESGRNMVKVSDERII